MSPHDMDLRQTQTSEFDGDEAHGPRAEPVAGKPLIGLNTILFQSVQVALRAELGSVSMSVEDLLALTAGSVLKLDRMLIEPVELFLNDTLVARGEIVAVEDKFAVRLIEVAPK